MLISLPNTKNRQKRLKYKEATKTIPAIFMLNLTVDISNQGNPGPSIREFDEFGGDLKRVKKVKK